MGFEKDKQFNVVDKNKHITHLWDVAGEYSKKENLYMSLFKEVNPNFIGGSVLEVGPGTGEFALRMHQNYNIERYTILDLEKNIQDSKDLFKRQNLKGHFITSSNYEMLFGKSFTIFISNICLPETPDYYWKNLINNVASKCKYIFIIGSDNTLKTDYNKWVPETIKKLFQHIVILPSGYCNTFLIYGENNVNYNNRL